MRTSCKMKWQSLFAPLICDGHSSAYRSPDPLVPLGRARALMRGAVGHPAAARKMGATCGCPPAG